ncbi:MAG: hypothetical protein J6S14_06045 [Clostridia bacterium]|nr:hypothetical protein [Clostridia bacterium]
MKKLLSLILLCTLTLSLSSCGTLNFVDIEEFSSEIYTGRDIADAMEVVLEEFQGKKDRILLNLSYIGDAKIADYRDWADRNGADEVIVFLTDYYVSFFSDTPTQNTASEYENWKFILVRSNGGEWEIVDQGY